MWRVSGLGLDQPGVSVNPILHGIERAYLPYPSGEMSMKPDGTVVVTDELDQPVSTFGVLPCLYVLHHCSVLSVRVFVGSLVPPCPSSEVYTTGGATSRGLFEVCESGRGEG